MRMKFETNCYLIYDEKNLKAQIVPTKKLQLRYFELLQL